MTGGVVLLVAIVTHASLARAQGPADLDRATRAIRRALPGGWSVIDQEDGQIPYGHHWCGHYDGPKGTKLVALGVKDVQLHLQGQDGEWYTRPAAKESLDLWVTPAGYRDSWWSWLCYHRPIQPVNVVRVGAIRIFAQPSLHVNSEDEFRTLISTATAFAWPDAAISWRTWQDDLATVLKGEFVE
jgi:hypothetical protein